MATTLLAINPDAIRITVIIPEKKVVLINFKTIKTYLQFQQFFPLLPHSLPDL